MAPDTHDMCVSTVYRCRSYTGLKLQCVCVCVRVCTKSSLSPTSLDSLVVIDPQCLPTGSAVQHHHIQMVEGPLQ